MASAHGNPQHPWWRVPVDAFAASRLGATLFRPTLQYLDRPLMRLTGGRLHSGFGMPFGLLTTTGARTGQRRTTPVIFIRYRAELAVIGTHFGSHRHPGWYFNLRRDPRAEVLLNGERFDADARLATPDEEAEIWPEADRVYPGYRKYRQRVTSRHVPIFLLSRVSET